MSSPVVTLAVFDGYWGQVFEYWPFTLLVAITIIYAIIAFGSDMISRRRWKPPAGATPRMEFPIDPAMVARARFRTGVDLIRFGSVVTVAAASLFCYLAFNPLAIGNNYGLSQEVNNATATGTSISLVFASLALIAAIYIRRLPMQLVGFILVAMAVVVLSPAIADGEPRWLGITATALALPLAMIVIGSTLAIKHYAGTKRAIPYITSAAPPPVGVS